jgi:hypothetical protein
MAEYQVEWLMDITADTPLEAAEKAHAIMLDRFSEAVVFKVTDQAEGKARTERYGSWFYGYTEE